MDVEDLNTIGVYRYTSIANKVPADIRIKVKKFRTHWYKTSWWMWTSEKSRRVTMSAHRRADVSLMVNKNRK